jgi:hypothetical protein
LENHASEGIFHITFCFLYCDVDSPSVGLAVHFFVHPVLCLQIYENNENCDSIGLNIISIFEKSKIQRSSKASVLNYTYIYESVIHISVKL